MDPNLTDPSVNPKIVNQLLSDVHGMRCGLVLVAGAVGSGRSETLRELEKRLLGEPNAATVVFGSFSNGQYYASGDDAAKVGPISRAIGGAAQLGTTAALFPGWIGLLGQLSYLIGDAFDLFGRNLTKDVIDTSRLMHTILRGLSSQPLIWIVDDIDQADSSWSILFKSLATLINVDQPQIKMIVSSTGGPDLVDAAANFELQMVSVLEQLDTAHRLTFRPIPPVDVAYWLKNACPQLVDELVNITQGNGHLLSVTWQTWVDERFVVREKGLWCFAGFGERSRARQLALHSLLVRLNAGLPKDGSFSVSEAQRLLGVAAIEGRTFTPLAISRVAGVHIDDLLKFLNESAHQICSTIDESRSERDPPDSQLRYAFRNEAMRLVFVRYGVPIDEQRNVTLALARALAAIETHFDAAYLRNVARLYYAAGDKNAYLHYRRRSELPPDALALEQRAQLMIAQQVTSWSVWEAKQFVHHCLVLARQMSKFCPAPRRLPLLRYIYELSEQYSMPLVAAGMAQAMGQVHDDLGEIAEARTWFFKAIEAAESAGSVKSLAVSYAGLGSVETNVDNDDDAYDLTLGAIELLMSAGMRSETASLLTNLAGISHALGRLELCDELAQEAMQIAKENNDPDQQSHALYWLATAEHDRGNLLRAREYAQQSLEFSEESHSPREKFQALRILASVEGSSGDVDRQRAHLREALDISEAMNYESDWTHLAGDLAHVAHELKDYEQVRELSGRLLQSRASSPVARARAHFHLSDCARVRNENHAVLESANAGWRIVQSLPDVPAAIWVQFLTLLLAAFEGFIEPNDVLYLSNLNEQQRSIATSIDDASTAPAVDTLRLDAIMTRINNSLGQT